MALSKQLSRRDAVGVLHSIEGSLCLTAAHEDVGRRACSCVEVLLQKLLAGLRLGLSQNHFGLSDPIRSQLAHARGGQQKQKRHGDPDDARTAPDQ